jgi:hypothetical protein
VLADRAISTLRYGIRQMPGLSYSPMTTQGFTESSDAVLGFERVGELLDSWRTTCADSTSASIPMTFGFGV